MARKIIDIGIQGNDGTGDSIRESFRKVNENFIEIYKIFGGDRVTFAQLDDGVPYSPNQIIMGNNLGDNLSARTITAGAGINITVADDTKLTIGADVANLAGDPKPQLGGPLNANSMPIGNVATPTQQLVDQYNASWEDQTITINDLAVNVGYANEHFVQLASNGRVGVEINGTIVPGPLRARDEPLIPDTADVDYDQTLSSNYLSSEVLPRKNVVVRSGDKMTGPLTLHDHPSAMAGFSNPNGDVDLQAATAFYVDNSTFSSNVNLYVSTSGNDLQTSTPAGKEGRFWNYAYRTISAALLQADSLITISSQEPGPYRQRISYTVGVDQTFSTISSVSLSGGNTSDESYVAAFNLLQANRSFIQAETIAYINRKFVNPLVYSKSDFRLRLDALLTAVGDDIALDTTYNTYRTATEYFNAAGSIVPNDQLLQTIDALEFAKNQLLDFSYNDSATKAYTKVLMSAIADDLAFRSNYNSINAALAFSTAGTKLSAEQVAELFTLNPISILSAIGNGSVTTITFADQGSIVFPANSVVTISGMPPALNNTFTILSSTTYSVSFNSTYSGSSYTLPGTIDKFNIINKILNIVEVQNNSDATADIKANALAITDILLYDRLPDVKISNLETTSTGKSNAKTLLLANLNFIQSEIIAYLNSEFPNVLYNKDTCKRDVKFMIWGILYDLIYGGNSQSIYVGNKYWANSVTSNIADFEKPATIAAVNHISVLVQSIISNTAVTTVYQQSVNQYRNSTLTNGSEAEDSLTSNLEIIASLISTYNTLPVTVPATVLTEETTLNDTNSLLRTIRTNLISGIGSSSYVYSVLAVNFVNQYFPMINDVAGAILLGEISDRFQLVIDPINSSNIGDIAQPVYSDSSDNTINFARSAIIQNLEFLSDDGVGYIAETNPLLTFSTTIFKRNIRYMLQAICYDLTYGGNSASLHAAGRYYDSSNNLTISTEEKAALLSAIDRLKSTTNAVVKNNEVSPKKTLLNQVTNNNWNGNTSHETEITTLFDSIKDIINQISVDTDAPLYPQSAATTVRNLIINNTLTVVNDTITYLDTTYKGGFNYDEGTCNRDIGLIIDAVSIDILTAGDWQSIYAGRSYYKNASARSVAIGTQRVETLTALAFVQELSNLVLQKDAQAKFQSLVLPVTTITSFASDLINVDGGSNTVEVDLNAIAALNTGMNTIINIIKNGLSSLIPDYGTGIWAIAVTNGGNKAVDQGVSTNNDIIPAKVLVGVTSAAYATVVEYLPANNSGSTSDIINVRATKPGFFVVGEQVEFGETVSDLQITIFVESGVYYEDYPLRLPANCSIKGDDFRRSIIRPRDRASQSPWKTVFFYRDAIIDALEVGLIDYTTDYALDTSVVVSSTSTISVTITLTNNQAPTNWIGKVLVDTKTKQGKAVVDSISGNILNCSVIYPFSVAGLLEPGEWHLYGTINYGRHYLVDPLDENSSGKNNKDIDVFLCNDATRIENLTFQGHGGFAMVLDPEGQIKTKSPYGQVCSSFSQSNNSKRFAGGQFVDGFAGRLRGTIIDIQYEGSTITVQGTVNSGLDIRPPRAPCAFFVQGNRYQVNDVKFTKSTRTAILTLDANTPFMYTYNPTTCARDIGLMLDAFGFDLVLGSTFQAVYAGISYLRAYSSVVTNSQKLQTISAIKKTGELAKLTTDDLLVHASINTGVNIICSILDQGVSSIPEIVWGIPAGSTSTSDNVLAKNIIQANKEFIQYEITSWLADNRTLSDIPNYNTVTCQRDVGYILDALCYDLLYGGNSQTKNVAESYWRTVSYIAGEELFHQAAFERLSTVLTNIVAGTATSVWGKSVSNTLSQTVTSPPSVGSRAGFQATLISLCSIIIDYVQDGDYDTPVATVLPDTSHIDYVSLVAIQSEITLSKNAIINGGTVAGTSTLGVLHFLDHGAGLEINIEMGGNKSMLANDFAMINDLGYAIVCTNGAVSEQVSTFTYYCWTHYWANNGGQIRSVAGSNAHGQYGLRASGYDVTELPDVVSLENNMMQTAIIYKRGVTKDLMTPNSTNNAIEVYIYGYEFTPELYSELEIDHTLFGGTISRYEVNNVQHTTVNAGTSNVLKLNLSTSGNNATTSTGLATALYDGQLVIIRSSQCSQFNGIDNVNPTRPSTALQYRDNLSSVYRIIAYNLSKSTGELLPDHSSSLQSDTAFNFYKFTTDVDNLDVVDPTDPAKTHGSLVGDTKIAVIPVVNQSYVDQINKGIYITSWAGRTHRIFRYVQSETIATGVFSNWNAGTSTLTVTSIAGIIEVGDIIIGTNISTGVRPTVTDVNLDTGVITVSLTGGATIGVIPPLDILTFGVSSNSYIEIDSIPIKNNAATGTSIAAVDYISSAETLYSDSNIARLVTYAIPYSKNEVYPSIDSYVTLGGNASTYYNKPVQVTDLTSYSQISVASTASMKIGMKITCNAGLFSTKQDTIITSINSGTVITVSPACWIPNITGTTPNISATLASVLDSITINNRGYGYTTAPTIEISNGGGSGALVTCAIDADGSITNITIVNKGFGYSSTPDLTITGTLESGGYAAELTPVLTTFESVTTTVSSTTVSTLMTVVYPTDPGVSGNALSSTSDNITLSSVAGLALDDSITFSGSSMGGIVPDAVYYIKTINTSSITISETVGGGTFTVTSDVGPMAFYSVRFKTATSKNATSWTSTTVPATTGDPYLVRLATTNVSPAPTTDAYYRVSNNSNPMFNGIWKCTGGGNNYIILSYPGDPGTWGTATTTTVTLCSTAGTSLQTGISRPFSFNTAYTIRAGFAKGTAAQITTRISTCRATGHDFLDIGTGSYSTTNYPYQIYGNPAQSRQPDNEVKEDGVGRVFYVTTDQNGIFRVGRYFTVDQGTGTVTFSASIALSNLDGLGFKRGVVINEFSTDSTMTNNAPEIVPVQSAVRGYIDKRLGLDHNNNPLAASARIGPGFLPLNGIATMRGALLMGSNPILGIGMTSEGTCAATKDYVDTEIAKHDQLSEMSDVYTTTPSLSNILVYNGVTSKWNNMPVTGDCSLVYNPSAQGGATLTLTISAGTITNSMISSSASISQSKLSLSTAPVKSSNENAVTADRGVASFSDTQFSSSNGWITLKTSTSASSGVTTDKLQFISNNTVLGNRSGSTGAVTEVSFANLISDGGGISNSSFASSGAMIVAYNSTTNNSKDNVYSTVGITTIGAADKLVKTGAFGEIDTSYLKIDSYKIIDTAVSGTAPNQITSVVMTTPGGYDFLKVSGTSISTTKISVFGELNVATTGASLISRTLSTGLESTSGTITGQWEFSATSQLDLNTRSVTLKAFNLTTDGTDTGAGAIQGSWTLTGASKLQATYADLAEYYEGDIDYEPGTVLVFGGDKEVTISSTAGDTKLAGVVTTNPAYVMNVGQTGIKVCIALVGRTPVKVIGQVKKGEFLTSSNVPGYAIRTTTPVLGAIIGKALENKDYNEAGVIEVAIGRV